MSGSWRPVSTRELRRLALRLEASAYCRTVLTNELRNLLKQPEYCDWLAKGRLAAEPYRGQVPEALISLGLAPLENGLGLQVQFLNNSLFLMDTPAQESVPIQERVEPQD